jgi:ATP-dependent DNA ligase
MRLRLVKEPFDNSDYIFELKHDGFRAIAYIDSGGCRLVSRNLRSLCHSSTSVHRLERYPYRARSWTAK